MLHELCIKKLTTIGYVCSDDKCRIVYSKGTRIGDVSALMFCQTFRDADCLKIDNLMIESDSQIVINSVLHRTKASNRIINNVRDIIASASQ